MKQLVALFFLTFPGIVMAQTADELSKLPKEKLVDLAVAKITEPSFKLTDFPLIEVWLEEGEITVHFLHPIKFIPRRGQFYYTVIVSLPNGSPTQYIEGNGPDQDDVDFYKPAEFAKEIKFVLDAINSSDEVGKIPEGQMPDGTMTIREELMYYQVSVDSESTHSFYKIKKGSGKIYDAGHKHYYRRDDESKRRQIY